MRKVGLALALIATPVVGQTTNCTTFGNQTTCTSTPDPMAGSNAAIQNLLNQPGQIGQAWAQGQQVVEQQRASVGALIARGDCSGARRLAAYYGQRAIQRDVEAACR